MYLRDTQLKGIPVVSKSGENIGKLRGVVIETNHHDVVQYVVTKSRFLSTLLPKEFLIHSSQVVELDAEKMVVNDNVITEKVSGVIELPEQVAGQTPSMTSSMKG